ncbi:MAG TPA: carbohydrate kinase family protein [Verrucomicrobiae bacterium]|nr:carbohydrate kinase family protein [Verrucomicrobiae bacterium]
MYDFLSIGDTSHNVFLEMTDDTVHINCRKNDENCEICFSWADKIPVKALHDTIGGNSANAAVSFARLGLKTALYTHVGKDDQGERIVKTLQADNIDTDFVVTDNDKMSNFSTVINLHGERSILVYHEHRHYAFPKIEPAKWIYLSSMGEGSESIFPDICAYTEQHQANLCYQPGTFQLKLGSAPAAELLRHTKVFMVNKEEAEMYLGIEKTEDFRQHLDGILALGPKIALVTDGTKGAYVSDGNEYIYLGIIEEAPRNEATGAGDSFSSAFAAALSHGKTLGEAMLWGQAQASSCIQQVGPQAGLLPQSEIEAILAAHPGLQPEPMR